MLASKITQPNISDTLPTHKTCSKCHQSKLICEFHKNKSGKYGVGSFCKGCRCEYYQANRERHLETCKVWNKANKERHSEYSKVWNKANPDKCRSYQSKRRAIKKLAFPLWARTGEIKTQIDAIYTEAKDLELFHGESYHVDHIIPLQSNFVCGLHVPANLRPLVGKENFTKNNSFTPYIENSSEIEIDMVELRQMVDQFLGIKSE